MPKRSPLVGIGLMLLAIVCFSLLDATSKYLTTRHFPVPLLVWVRYILHFLVMVLFLGSRTRAQLVATKRPVLQVVRALVLLGVTGLSMAAFRLLPLAEATSILFITPLVVAVLAGPFLSERVGLPRWVALVAGFSGMLIVVRPGGALVTEGVLFALATAACHATSQLQTRMLSIGENTWTTLLYTAFVGTIASSLILPFYWVDVTATWTEMLLIASLALYGGLAQFLMIEAFRHAPASTLAPLLYTQLAWAGILGWVLFGQFPDTTSLVGMAIIVTSSIGIVAYERRLQTRKATV